MRTLWTKLHRRWAAAQVVCSPGLLWLFLRVVGFSATVPLLMRIRLPALDRLLERRIASAAAAGGDGNEPEEIVRCVESALTVGAPLIRRGCLTRGLTLYYFLRRAGLDVVLCFGARWRDKQKEQLTGHCWLERGGKPFLEGEGCDRYADPIYRLPAAESVLANRG
jgi:Transglutaminase-like superfamily